MAAPRVVAFDVIETLFPLEPLRARLSSVGLSERDLEPFFARVLRDAFALDTTGDFVPFKEIAASVLGQMGVDATDHATVFDGFAQLDAYDDVRPAFEALNAAGVPVLCLTNGNPDVTRACLDRNDLTGLVARTISIEEIGVWKPRAQVYTYAADAAGVAPADMALVACHPWDCHGALRAGCMAGFVERGAPYGSAMAPPTVTGQTLPEVVEALLAF